METNWDLGNRKAVYEPFVFASFHDVLPPQAATDLLEWLEAAPNFTRQNNEFYRYAGFHVGPLETPVDIRRYFSSEAMAAIRQQLEEIFETPLGDNVALTANRYDAGDGTLIHTDYAPEHKRDEFSPTHRFILYLNRGWSQEDGGILGAFSSSDAATLSATHKPIHNSAFALEIQPNSYHAVSAVKQGPRYTLNFTLRALS